MTDWFDDEMTALDQRLLRGEITPEQHTAEARQLRLDAQDEDDRQMLIDAGRGHLLRDW